MTRRFVLACFALAALGFVAGRGVAQPKPATPAAAPLPPPPTDCKTYGSGRCCDVSIAAHLSKAAVFSACGESDATYLGEQGSKDTCKYFFKVAGQKDEDMFVQVYAPAAKDVPAAPNDPFFKWKKIGPVFMTEKALSPKAAPMMENSTGLWLPGKGYFVAINASTKVCSKPEAKRLAGSLK
ncbi:MAG TPA: hypothetical protein VMZ28_16810 [Kofleriaceae bacterium]|nr:hypothetical protein [Kofleriaceae bacterium]